MIIVRNRELLIPRNEAFIGTKFDVDAENRYFKIDRMLPSQIDLSGFTFALDVKYADGTSDTLSATKDITDDSLVLKVSFSSSMPVGDMRIQLRASDVSGRRWSSAEAVLYVMDTISNPGSVTPSTTLTELEQTETRIEASEGVRIGSESARVLAESGRVSAETGRVNAEAARASAESSRDVSETQRGLNEVGRQAVEAQRVLAESGRASAETARVNAENERVTAETAREASFEAKSKLAESWAVGGTGTRPGEDSNNAKYYAEKANEERSLQPVIISDYWHIWNPETEQYENTGVKASGDIAEGAVQYDTVQTLTEAEKLVARTNIDAYSKPSSGVPKTDLEIGVQASLNLADTALQEHQDISGKQDVISDLSIIRSRAAGAVRHDVAQTLTDPQKAQARENIGVFLDLKDTVTHTQYRLGIENGIMYIEDYEEET